jgi:hypothetical protein
MNKRNKINFSSRYYDAFQILKNKVDSTNYFRLIHNEDKETYSLPYLYGNYKNEIEPITTSNRIIESIQNYFSSNLYNKDEIKLLLTELIPFSKLFGNNSIDSLKTRIEFAQKDSQDYSVYINECEKTIKVFEKINEIINYELTEIYTSLVSNNNSSNNMTAREKIAELIFDQFRKSNSCAGHIVMMSVFNLVLIPKLNPKEQDLFKPVASELIENGFITYEKSSPECLRLTEKGFDYIYEDTDVSPLKSIIIKKELPSSDFPEKVYEDVIKTLTDYGKDLEQKSKIYKGQSEEGLRDHFLTNLTGRYDRTTATGETFNSTGKTDILLKDDKGNNLFIAECKWWTGPVGFHSTINQLFDNYVTWRDTKLALLFFVDNIGFTEVLNQIETESKNHKYYVKYKGVNNKSNFSFIFRQKDDEKNEVNLEILFFHFPKKK